MESARKVIGKKSQGAFEYILLLGGVILIVVIGTIVMRSSVLNQVNQQIEGNANEWNLASGICTTSEAFAVYHLDESSGATASDSSKNKRTLSVGSAVRRSVGTSGNALNFSGYDANAYAWNFFADTSLQKWTIEAWIYPTNLNYRQKILQTRAGPWSDWGLYVSGSPKKLCYYVEGAGCVVTGNMPLKANQWQHVAVTYDGSLYTLYLDGKKDGSSAAANHDWNMIGIGGLSGDTETFIGLIDEVKIYQNVRSGNELLREYKYGCTDA